MFNYIVRRLLLLPVTLFFIVLVNFVIVNLAPGEPVSITEISPEGMASRQANSSAVTNDERYLQFREFYGLTLPILFNSWTTITQEKVDKDLWSLLHHRYTPDDPQEMSAKDYNALRVKFGDQARFVMPMILRVIQDPKESLAMRSLASKFFIRGSFQLANVGPQLTEEQKEVNSKLMKDNDLLQTLVIKNSDNPQEVAKKVQGLKHWYEENKGPNVYEPTRAQKVQIFFFDTRFYRYLSRVVTLNFGTLRNDDNKTVISEVTRRFKYSLTLSLTPMLITFVLCQLFGFLMAYKQNRWPDYSLNLGFLILYAIPIFIVAPFLIEMALNRNFPFTQVPIPISGFTSPDDVYENETSLQRLFDVVRHILLPLIAIMYGSLAAQARLARTGARGVAAGLCAHRRARELRPARSFSNMWGATRPSPSSPRSPDPWALSLEVR